MPADKDKNFYDLLDSVAVTTGDEDAIAQNKRIKEAEFAEDSREPTAEEEEELKRFVEQNRHKEEAGLAKDARSATGQGHGDGHAYAEQREVKGVDDSVGKGTAARMRGVVAHYYVVAGLLSQGGETNASRGGAEVNADRLRKDDHHTENAVQKERGAEMTPHGPQQDEHHKEHHRLFHFPHHHQHADNNQK